MYRFLHFIISILQAFSASVLQLIFLSLYPLKTLLSPTASALEDANPLPEDGTSAIVVNSIPFLILNNFKLSRIILCLILLTVLTFSVSE